MEPVSNADKLAEIRKRFELRLLDESEIQFLLSEIDRLQSIQQERDKLLRKLEYKDLIISNAVELIEDREEVISNLRSIIGTELLSHEITKYHEMIDAVVDNGKFNVGVGEEGT
jgi:hypothetical protein